MKAADGAAVVFVSIVLLALAAAVGSGVMRDSIRDDCKHFGFVMLGGVKYQCKPLGE